MHIVCLCDTHSIHVPSYSPSIANMLNEHFIHIPGILHITTLYLIHIPHIWHIHRICMDHEQSVYGLHTERGWVVLGSCQHVHALWRLYAPTAHGLWTECAWVTRGCSALISKPIWVIRMGPKEMNQESQVRRILVNRVPHCCSNWMLFARVWNGAEYA